MRLTRIEFGVDEAAHRVAVHAQLVVCIGHRDLPRGKAGDPARPLRSELLRGVGVDACRSAAIAAIRDCRAPRGFPSDSF